jgi:hypothetical protein
MDATDATVSPGLMRYLETGDVQLLIVDCVKVNSYRKPNDIPHLKCRHAELSHYKFNDRPSKHGNLSATNICIRWEIFNENMSPPRSFSFFTPYFQQSAPSYVPINRAADLVNFTNPGS